MAPFVIYLDFELIFKRTNAISSKQSILTAQSVRLSGYLLLDSLPKQ